MTFPLGLSNVLSEPSPRTPFTNFAPSVLPFGVRIPYTLYQHSFSAVISLVTL